MTLYESLINNIGLGKDTVNRKFLDDMFKADYGESTATDIFPALELPAVKEKDVRKAVLEWVNKWGVEDVYSGRGMRIKDFQIDDWKNSNHYGKDSLGLIATILWREPSTGQTDSCSASIIYIDTDCLRVLANLDINKQISKLFAKNVPYTEKYGSLGQNYKMEYIQYDWKDCKTVLQ